MKFNAGDLIKPLRQARNIEENGKYEKAMKLFLDYYDACINQNEFGLKSLSKNLPSALKGATRCYIKMNKITEAKELLTEKINFFKDDYEEPYYALMRSKIENIYFELLDLEKWINTIWYRIDDFLSGEFFKKVDTKGWRVSHFLTEPIGNVIRKYREIYAIEVSKNLLDSVVSKIKSNLTNEVTWEPQFFADVAIYYTFSDNYEEAINLILFAYDLIKRYSDDVPANFKIVEGNSDSHLIEWNIVINNYDESKKWLLKIEEKALDYAGLQYIKLKEYDMAKKCFEKSIPNKPHDLPFYLELINFCDIKLKNEINLESLEKAKQIYKKNKPKNHPDLGINKLRISRINSYLKGFDRKIYESLINELKEKALFKEDSFSPYPLTFIFGLMGVCYLKLNNREFAIKSFEKIKEIEKAEKFVEGWECEPDYFFFYDYIKEEMILNEIYTDKYEYIRSPNDILNYVFTDDEFIKFIGKTKKEYFQKGIQGEPGEIQSIHKARV